MSLNWDKDDHIHYSTLYGHVCTHGLLQRTIIACRGSNRSRFGPLRLCEAITHWAFCSTQAFLSFHAHSRKDRLPHTGHLRPWDLTWAPAAGWSPGRRGLMLYWVVILFILCHYILFKLRALSPQSSVLPPSFCITVYPTSSCMHTHTHPTTNIHTTPLWSVHQTFL